MRARPLIDILAVWALLAAVRLSAGWDFVQTGTTGDPDSVMRLMQIRDWLGGQGWFDLQQYRIGFAGGVAMHWTRVADLLPGGIVALLTPIVGARAAEHAALVATPLLLLLAATALTLGIVRALAGRTAPITTAAVMATSLGMLTVFAPGNIDHHGLQIVCVLALLRACVGTRDARAGLGAALATVTSMVVGIETAPVILAVLGSVALLWVADPARERRFVAALGAGLAGASALAALAFLPRPIDGGFCDAWTPAVAALTGCAGLVFLLAARLTARPLALRLALPLLVAALIAAAVVTAWPACRVHPAGDDALLWRYWMDGVSENQSLATLMRDNGAGAALVYLGVAPLALLAGIATAWRLRDRAWLPALVALIAALGLTLLHIRGQAMLSALAAPVAAALIARAALRPGARRILVCAALLPIGWLVAGVTLMRPASDTLAMTQAACRSDALIAALNALPPATLVVPMMTEPHLLAATRHRSLAATYHRNRAGNHAMIAAMIADPARGRAMLAAAGVGYVVYCPGYDSDGYARANPASLAAALRDRTAVAGLDLVRTLPGGVTIARVGDSGTALGKPRAAR